jgi:hypothetical protein
MIRVYFDWNVISSLKRPEFKELNDFITEYKGKLVFPYSPAHFKDLMKSYSPNNAHFNTDLETLNYLSDKHFIRWGKDGIEALFGTPKEYFEGEKEVPKNDILGNFNIEKIFSELDNSMQELGLSNIGNLVKLGYQLQPSGIKITDENRTILAKMFPNLNESSNMWDFMKDIGAFMNNLTSDGEYYKDFRKALGETGFKLEANSGNWNEDDVIKNIDKFLLSLNTKMTFLEYVETCLKYKEEPYSRYVFFTTAYLMLDMIGYKQDKLPKPTDNMLNIQTDGEHSFYGGYCDYFVGIDKKLRTKSKVLYNEFNLPVPVLTPEEFLQQIKQAIHIRTNHDNFLNEAVDFFKEEYIVETLPASEDHEVEALIAKLPVFYFDFFNYGIYQYYKVLQYVMMVFKRTFKNYSKFIYYTEAEKLVEEICKFFGHYSEEEIEIKKKEFAYGDRTVELSWQFNGGLIKLEKDEETKRPILLYLVKVENQ